MISESFPKTFNITVLFKCLILLLIFTTPVLSAISSSVYDEGISSDVLYSKAAPLLWSHKQIYLNLFHDVDFFTRIDKVVNNRSGSAAWVGVATGIPGGAGVGANNHLGLNNTASTVANSRTSRTALSVSLVIVDTTYVGDKITFLLRATASGGTGSYNFSWSGAYPDHQSTPTTNPNYARRTILSTQTVTVSVTVTSGAETVTKYKKLIDF